MTAPHSRSPRPQAIAARETQSQGSIFRMLELRSMLARARELYRELR